ncbi:MAG: Rieske 2Fe-2S domain-containing protein [Candidatus Manganitrophus sp.]|nr:MAG: Rieske 2Fe-2S domain-containing protein [Candidatus Manganitrophus sp.]
MSAEFVKVAWLQEIPMEKGKVIQVEGKEIALFRSEGSVYAIDNLCLHEGGPLGHGPVKDGIVTCPWHLWRFDVRTGAMVEAPSMKVDCFTVKVEGEDVYLDVSSLTAPVRRNQTILRRLVAGETAEALGKEYHLIPEEIERIARQARIGERLVWLGELFQRQGAIYSQDLLRIPYRDLEGISYGAQEKLDELIELL